MTSEECKAAVEKSVRDAIAAGKPVERAPLVQRYTAKGMSRSLIYAWIKAEMDRHPNQAPPHTPEQGAFAADVAALPNAAVLRAIESEGVTGPGADKALERLQGVIDAATRVLNSAHHPDGRVKNPRLALAGAESLRRCLETSLKLYETINNLQTVERFLGEVMAELRAADPEFAKRVVERMRVVQGRWT